MEILVESADVNTEAAVFDKVSFAAARAVAVT